MAASKKFPIPDPVLQKAVRGIELQPLIPQTDYFNYLIRSVVYQQLSGKAAGTIYGRFADLFPKGTPTPDKIIRTPMEQLRAAGLSGQKSTYIQNIAHFARENDFTDTYLNTLDDHEVIAYLTQIKGVGKWTVEMLLMFAMLRPDVFPIDDFGVSSGIQLMYGLDPKMPKKQMRDRLTEIASAWSPHRSLASRYIWAWKDRQK